MQFNRYLTIPKSSLFTNKLFLLLRFILFLAIGIYLWQSFVSNQKVLLNVGSIKTRWHFSEIILFCSVFLLLPVNWSLEALKWQIIANNSKVTFIKAMRGVLLGTTLDHIIPLGGGSISGRIIGIPKEDRLNVIPGILVGQICQSIVTFAFGLYGLWMIWNRAIDLLTWPTYYSVILLIVILIITISIMFWKDTVVSFLRPLKRYTFHSWFMIFSLSLTRYIVFLIQFAILAKIFSPELELNLVLGCATWVFAARTFMPNISNLEKLGIRALAVVFFMDLFALSSAGLLVTVVVLWIVNLAIPSLFGLTLFRNIKLDTLLK